MLALLLALPAVALGERTLSSGMSGEDVLDEIAGVRTNYNDRPLEEQKMTSIVIEEA